MGTPRHAGVLVMGTNLPAVDATCARLMEINPWRIDYLVAASGRSGPIAERHIDQRGEIDRGDETEISVARSSVVPGLEDVNPAQQRIHHSRR